VVYLNPGVSFVMSLAPPFSGVDLFYAS
jgi:hypothetical protein